MDGQKFSFGTFTLDAERKLLQQNGAPVALGQRGVALLEALLKAGGKAVSKSDLMDIAWPAQQVEENNLSVQIAALRKCLGPAPGGDNWIATVARVGYRFAGTCEAVGAPANTAPSHSPVEKPTIAVLPFDNPEGDAAQRLFSDGLSEEIINGLSRFSSLTVIARHSSFRFRDAADVGAAAQQLGVRYLVTGNLRRSGERLRLSVQLVEAGTGRQLWSGRFDRDITGLFAMQDEVTQLIVASLTGQVETLEIRSAMARPTKSLEAYGCLLHGIESLRSYGEGVNRTAIEMFERAIDLDPAYGLAHGYLALALLVEYGFEQAPQPVKDRALSLALKGVQLAPDDSRCHQYLGDAYLYLEQYDLALAQIERSIALNPNDANALTRYAIGLAKVGRAEEGLEAAHRAIRNNPFHPDYYWLDLAIVAYAARRYEEALSATRRIAPHGRYWDHARMAACLAQLGRVDEARAAAQTVLQLKPDFSILAEPFIYANAADLEHVREGLRKAGLPE
jgi:TolB-like protein/Flp pilus assembly protein TadD